MPNHLKNGDRTYEPQEATRIKPHEHSRLNTYWCDVTEERPNLAAQLNRTWTYLWVLREDQHLIIGHEDDQNCSIDNNSGILEKTTASWPGRFGEALAPLADGLRALPSLPGFLDG